MIYNTVKVGKLYLSSLVLSSIEDDLSAQLSAYATKIIETSSTIEYIFPSVFEDAYTSNTLSFNDIQGYVISWLGRESGATLTYNVQTHEMVYDYDYYSSLIQTTITPEDFQEHAKTSEPIILESEEYGAIDLLIIGNTRYNFSFTTTKDVVYVEGGEDGIYATVDEKIGSLSTVYQTKLTNTQISAIDSVVDARQTVIDFGGGDVSTFNWVGEIDVSTIIDAGLFNTDPYAWHWTKYPYSVKIGNAISSIGTETFIQCYTLSNIVLPNSIVNIGNFAFYGCDLISSIKIPSTVSSIGTGAFWYCNFDEIVIPDNVLCIGQSAFMQLEIPAIKKIIIGKNVSYIGHGAFMQDNDSSILSIVVKGKTQSEAETLLKYAGVPLSVITTWNDASQEWVKEQVDTLSSKLSNYEPISAMVSDVSSIVLSTITIDAWDFQFPQDVVDAGYTINLYQPETEGDDWRLAVNVNGIGLFEWLAEGPIDADSLTFNMGDGYNEYGIIKASKATRNALGLAMLSDLNNYLSSVPDTYKTYNATLSSLSSDGYATKTYAIHNLSGVANITSMPLSSYEAISATADAETLYVITED